MAKTNIKNALPENYNAPVIIMVTGIVNKVYSSLENDVNEELLNGCVDENFDGMKNIPVTEVKSKGPSPIIFWFNQPDKKLYVTNRYVFGRPLSEEQMQKLADHSQQLWLDYNENSTAHPALKNTETEEEFYVDVTCEDQEVNVAQVQIQIPENHYWLGSIFDTPEKMSMYEDFMQDPIIYRRFVSLCKMKNIPIPEEANESYMLPIHKRDRNTGEILISSVVLKVFQQYQYAMNFLNVSEFPIGSAEHGIGKLMMLYPKFCEFMMDLAEKRDKGIEIHDIEGNYNKAVDKAINYVMADVELTNFYENFWAPQIV